MNISILNENEKNIEERMEDTIVDNEEVNDAGENAEESKEDIIAEYREQLQRIQAEFINYRKRVEQDRLKDFSNAKGTLMLKILPVLDDFSRMLDHYQSKEMCSINDVKVIYKNFKKILFDEKLNEIFTVGENFDPAFHEAVGVVKTLFDNENKVMNEVQKGYTFDDKLLRPSRVIVGRYVNENKKSN